MPGTYSHLAFHVVFSTKHRTPWIVPDLAEQLYPFIGGIVRNECGVLSAIGGVADHVHLLINWRTDETIANLMRDVKTRSSRWVHEMYPDLHAFAWQEGYAVFSVSLSQAAKVKRYIANQEEHHRKEDFKGELMRILRSHEVEYDERFVV